ncbi:MULTISPECIES: hypothetical protein [Salinibaculum]|uniref:hypothetical protein n=1 Tax=Salinibaculum TaxID=2732368 RepID=UPI0030CB4CEE
MPNYPTHARWGRIGAVVVAIAVGSAIYALAAAPLLAAVGAVGAALATFVGAIYPDIDHHASIPRRKAVRGFQVVVAAGVTGLTAANWGQLLALAGSLGTGLPDALAAGGLAAVVGLVAVAGVDPAVGVATGEHRGWTHSTTVNFALLAVVAAGVWVLTADLGADARLVAVGLVGAFYLGTLVHLGLDGEIP